MIRVAWRPGRRIAWCRQALAAFAAGLVALLLAASPGRAAAAPSVIDLGVPAGYSDSSASAVNPAGVVVGEAIGDTDIRAIAWVPGPGRRYRSIDLGALPGDTISSALGISPSGLIVGYSGTNPHLFGSHAVVWRPEGDRYRIAALDVPAGYDEAVARGISPGGDVVGSAGGPGPGAAGASVIGPLGGGQGSGFNHAALWRSDGRGGYSFVDLGTLPDGTSSRADAGRAGRVVGAATVMVPNDPMPQQRAVLWTRGAGGVYGAIPLAGRPGDWYGEAFDINALGLAAGESLGPDQTAHAIVWSRSDQGGYGLTELPGGQSAQAFAISDTGVVVGDATTESQQYHATAWLPVGRHYVPLDLGTLPAASSSVASDVSASGLVVGHSGIDAVWRHATLWRLAGAAPGA